MEFITENEFNFKSFAQKKYLEASANLYHPKRLFMAQAAHFVMTGVLGNGPQHPYAVKKF